MGLPPEIVAEQPRGVCHKTHSIAPIVWRAVASHRFARKIQHQTYRKVKWRPAALQNSHQPKSSIAKKTASRVNFCVWKIQTGV
jgi:hypothetical protein